MNQADTAWMLISTALVLLMTPALAFFYGGLVRSKNSLNTMMMSFISLGFVGVLWAVIGYSLAFAPGNSMIGDTSRLFLRGVGLEAQGTIPHLLFMCYQGTFAIITAALISGAIVERMRFSAYVTFISLWVVVIYCPIAHWVWGGGWLAQMGALDFAGGTVVHVNAGVAALVAAVCVGKRSDYKQSSILPHNVPFVLLGSGLLWFGWFGFNAGSALGASPSAALAFTTTHAGAGRDAGGMGAARCDASGQADGGRRGDGHRGGPRGGHAGGWIHRPHERDCPRGYRGGAKLLRVAVEGEDATGRLARRGGGARRRRNGRRAAHRCLRAGKPERDRQRERLAVRQAGAARHPGGRCRAPRSSTAASAVSCC